MLAHLYTGSLARPVCGAPIPAGPLADMHADYCPACQAWLTEDTNAHARRLAAHARRLADAAETRERAAQRAAQDRKRAALAYLTSLHAEHAQPATLARLARLA